MPVWFFDLCNLESDPKMLSIANTTFDAYFPKGIAENTTVNVLSKLPVAGSMLGRVESTRYLIANQIRTTEIEVLRNRMDLREGGQTTSIQRLGRAAEALNFALCQSTPSTPGAVPIIRVFPAWPPEWDAQFTLLCRDAFMVTSSMKNGKIEFVEIASQAGSSCNLRNPWTGKEVTIYRNGKKWKNSGNALLQFPTKQNDRFIIVEKNNNPDQFKRILLVE